MLAQIELFLDGELDAGLELEIREHLDACGPCLDHSDFQFRLKDLLRTKGRCREVPAGLVERIRSMYGGPAG